MLCNVLTELPQIMYFNVNFHKSKTSNNKHAKNLASVLFSVAWIITVSILFDNQAYLMMNTPARHAVLTNT